MASYWALFRYETFVIPQDYVLLQSSVKRKSKVVSETNYRRNREDARETHEIACQ